MSWLTTTTLLLLAAVVLLNGGTGVAAEREIWEDIKDMDIFRIKDGSYACPLPVMGERCPNSNWLFYFKCCGDLNLNCCFRMQDWAVTLIAFFIILIIISALCNILRCIFCFN